MRTSSCTSMPRSRSGPGGAPRSAASTRRATRPRRSWPPCDAATPLDSGRAVAPLRAADDALHPHDRRQRPRGDGRARGRCDPCRRGPRSPRRRLDERHERPRPHERRGHWRRAPPTRRTALVAIPRGGRSSRAARHLARPHARVGLPGRPQVVRARRAPRPGPAARPSGPVILAPNHASNLDPVLIGAYMTLPLGRRVHWLGKREVFEWPVVGWAGRLGGVHGIERGGGGCRGASGPRQGPRGRRRAADVRGGDAQPRRRAPDGQGRDGDAGAADRRHDRAHRAGRHAPGLAARGRTRRSGGASRSASASRSAPPTSSRPAPTVVPPKASRRSRSCAASRRCSRPRSAAPTPTTSTARSAHRSRPPDRLTIAGGNAAEPPHQA